MAQTVKVFTSSDQNAVTFKGGKWYAVWTLVAIQCVTFSCALAFPEAHLWILSAHLAAC